MLRFVSALLFVLVVFSASLALASSITLQKETASRNKQNLLLKKIIKNKQIKQQKQQKQNINSEKNIASLPSVGDATRPKSTLPFIPRSSLTVLQRDLDECALGDSTVALDIPTRYMWGWGPGLAGYCGETSFQSSLLMYGSWVSAERVRYADGDEELLIGVNDEKAAKNLVLNYEAFDSMSDTAQQYLDKFVKTNIEAGNPVIMGFYEYIKGGDNEYDHIMIIHGVELSSSGDVVGIYFNDFHTKEVRYLGRYLKSGGGENPQWIASRKSCTGPSKDPEHPWNYCIPKTYQYSIALKGLNLDNPDGIYTRAIAGSWTEPDWGKEDGLHEKPVPMKITLVVNGNLKKGSTYVIQQFNSAAAVSSSGQKDVSWSHEFTQTNEDGVETTLTDVVSPMSDGEFYWVTIPK